jgi:hypothetical protein
MNTIKSNSKSLEIISTLLIFILLINFSGCYSFKPVSGSYRYILSNSTYHLIIQGKDNYSFLLKSPIVSDNVLSGKIDFEESYYVRNVIKIYPTKDYIFKIDSLGTFSIPLDRIAKVEKSEFSTVKTVVTGIISFCTLFIIWISSLDFKVIDF